MVLKFKFFILTITSILILNEVAAQNEFARDDRFIVLNQLGDTLKNPWAGGFNSVQFSEIDLNLDGIMDLFVFDRTGHKISTFINSGIPNQVTYQYDPSYIDYFPTGLKNWVLLRDYNCDGKMDLFTKASGGMSAYKNTSSTQLSFTLDTSLVYSDFQPDAAPNFINMWMSPANLPAIDDIDGDGDLDVLTINIFGAYIEYHKNMSMERYGTCDSLDFQLANKCWGYVRYRYNNVHTLNDTCSWNILNPEDITPIPHLDEGVSLLTIDVDSNDTKDLIVSSFNNKNFNLLTNNDLSGNQTASSLTSQDTLFPLNNLSSTTTDINIFPGGFYLDVNNDNVKDLIAAPNYPFACHNKKNVWYYENTNADNKPDLKLIQNDFIQEGMIEVGEGARPTFFDYNADGLMDIVIGNHGIYEENNILLFESSLHLYQNIGTTTVPRYQLIDTNYAGLSSLILNLDSNRRTLGLTPTFGDLDNDNDLDMIVGDYNGYIHYFTNTAGAGNTATFSLNQAQYLNINVGSDAAPLLYDLNNDNLLDLIIGKQLGTFSYYRNTGTANSPNFTLATDSLGKVTTRDYFNSKGNSNPIIIDSMGTTFMYSGSQNGAIYKYGNIDGNLTGTFTVVDTNIAGIWEGINSFITIADVTNDGNNDMIVGNYSGGVAFYTKDILISVPEKETLSELNIYPNPTTGLIHINFDRNNLDNAHIQVIDLLGKVLYSKEIKTKKTTIDLNKYVAGMYLIQFSNTLGNKVYKVIKK